MKSLRLALALLLSCPAALCSIRVDLSSGWRFRTDPAGTGEQESWMDHIPEGTSEVRLPHTWNMGADVGYQGTAWYFKELPGKQELPGNHVEIHFGATFYKSRLWLNGILVGTHEGGYTAYFFDLTPYLKDKNLLAVEINNKPGLDTIPGVPLKNGPDATIYDWWPYGGIVRDVWLTAGDHALLRWQHIDSRPAGAAAAIQNKVRIENFSAHERRLALDVAIYSANGREPVAKARQSIEVPRGAHEFQVALQLPEAKLWDFDNPYLYRMVASLSDDKGQRVDSLSDQFGVRTVEIRDRHLYLNGQRVRLSGLTRHEDSPWEGLAETAGTIYHDFDDLKNLQTTLTRPVHYPQNPLVYGYCDDKGILSIPEIPMWQFDESQMKNPRVLALAEQMLREMIEQNYNHPSIFAWSLDNESATDTPGGMAYARKLYRVAKELNPDRFVSLADDRIAFVDNPASNASSIVDFVMWNEYFGSWDGPESLLLPALERIGKQYPDKMVIISEFGTPGLFAADEKSADVLRVHTIREQLKLLAKYDWIGGAILWCYQDYHSYHNHRPGQQDMYVDHGVVDKDRQRRPSYFVWRKENAPAKLNINWMFGAKGTPQGFRANIERRPETDLPSYPLVNYRAEWTVTDQAGKAIARGSKTLDRMGSPQELSQSWAVSESGAFRVEFDLYRPTGFLAQRKVLSWVAPGTGAFHADPDADESDAPNEIEQQP